MPLPELDILRIPFLLIPLFWIILRLTCWGFWLNSFLVLLILVVLIKTTALDLLYINLLVVVPGLFCNTVLYALVPDQTNQPAAPPYRAVFPVTNGRIQIDNIRRGIGIIGAAGSGKTESVVYSVLRHFRRYSFCGIIHDYKNFELTEIAYPLFRSGDIPFYIISFDQIYHRVNPIAPRYLPDEESVHEVSRVLLENLLEHKDWSTSGTAKFFNDAAEGLIGGLIWRLKKDYPAYCSLPHLISLYQFLDTRSLLRFLEADLTSRGMADAFISGVESERQTAAVKSTLANALKKLSTHRIFMALSSDEVPLDINNPDNPALVSIVNNPKFETAYSPAIATVIHTMVKQMSVRHRDRSFILLEEAPTIRLLNMHRIPATLRSYDITTLYVMQDKIQNELLYGEKASKAILSNLSYQFFGKVNDPDTAKFYERFFEIIKRHSISTSQSEGLNFDTRITRSEKEVSSIRADAFFRLQPGEFVAFADGREKKLHFRKQRIQKRLPEKFRGYSDHEIEQNFQKIHADVRSLFRQQ